MFRSVCVMGKENKPHCLAHSSVSEYPLCLYASTSSGLSGTNAFRTVFQIPGISEGCRRSGDMSTTLESNKRRLAAGSAETYNETHLNFNFVVEETTVMISFLNRAESGVTSGKKFVGMPSE